jgi:fluoride ion exporter CrcB/FEX
VQARQIAGAGLYFVLSNALGFCAIVFGSWIGRKL